MALCVYAHCAFHATPTEQQSCWREAAFVLVWGMKATSRRTFIQQTGTFLAGAPFIARSAQSPSDRIVLGFVGPGGQGTNLLKSFGQMKDVAVAAVCDVDSK